MNRLLFIIALLIFFSCRSKEAKKLIVPVTDIRHIAKVDTVRREKFDPRIEYDKFKVDTFSGKRASIDYSSNGTAWRFRSTINWSINNFGINFAGHYNLARWGCGTSCVNGVITDFKTGNVYELPPASLDYKFQRDSRLLVINPPDSLGYYDYCDYCVPELWVWNENKKKFERLN